MTRYLLDTNAVSELRKRKPHGAVLAWMDTLRPEQIFLSAVTIGELQAGAELTRKTDPAKAAEIENWLVVTNGAFSVIPMDSACFREWARIKTGKSSERIEDAMIAATARVHGLSQCVAKSGARRIFCQRPHCSKQNRRRSCP